MFSKSSSKDRRSRLSYIERTLVPGESMLQTGRLHWIVYARAVTVALISLPFLLALSIANRQSPGFLFLELAAFLIFLIAVYSAIKAFIRKHSTEIAVTTRRFLVKRGFISRSVVEIATGQIESVIIRQSILGRILDYGTLIVAGTGSDIDPVSPVVAPLALRRAIDQLYRPPIQTN
jgi:uncharacterized membrane protein YdbT with pleckstrin-like domain